MPLYKYYCEEHGEFDIIKPMLMATEEETCAFCGKVMQKVICVPNIVGTRDSFGVGKEFVSQNTGKVIDNWKSWEKEGYMNPKDDPNLTSDMKQEAKRKEEKVKKYDNKKKFSVTMKGKKNGKSKNS